MTIAEMLQSFIALSLAPLVIHGWRDNTEYVYFYIKCGLSKVILIQIWMALLLQTIDATILRLTSCFIKLEHVPCSCRYPVILSFFCTSVLDPGQSLTLTMTQDNFGEPYLFQKLN